MLKLRLRGGSPPFIRATLAVPGISSPTGGNPDRCDLIASLHPPPAALRLFAYRLRPLSRRAYGDYPAALAGDQQESKRKHHPFGWCFFLVDDIGILRSSATPAYCRMTLPYFAAPLLRESADLPCGLLPASQEAALSCLQILAFER